MVAAALNRQRPLWLNDRFITGPGKSRSTVRCSPAARGRCVPSRVRYSPASHKGTLFRTLPDSFARHRRSRVPYLVGSTRIPATAREAISTTSSTGRRPLGNPAMSPARNPSRFCLATGVGGIPVLRRSRSATGPASPAPQPGQIGGSYCARISRSVRGCRSNRNPDRSENVRQQRIEERSWQTALHF